MIFQEIIMSAIHKLNDEVRDYGRYVPAVGDFASCKDLGYTVPDIRTVKEVLSLNEQDSKKFLEVMNSVISE